MGSYVTEKMRRNDSHGDVGLIKMSKGRLSERSSATKQDLFVHFGQHSTWEHLVVIASLMFGRNQSIDSTIVSRRNHLQPIHTCSIYGLPVESYSKQVSGYRTAKIQNNNNAWGAPPEEGPALSVCDEN